jgi:hypothetical protein
MQRLEFANKTSTSKSHKTEQQESKIVVENLREVKGAGLATSRNILRIQNSDTFYVQSEKDDNIYYFVRYNPSVFEWCSCPDNSIRGQKCKHQFAIEYAIKKGTLKDIDRLPIPIPITTDVNQNNQVITILNINQEQLGNHFLNSKSIRQTSRLSQETAHVAIQQQQKKSKSYLDDDYDF